ncbi:MAG: cytochrome-c oxidase [Candidatus Melainabacteria bacterium HGW-Melainabacteria-1]|nr:MAG: cytochrome-c oxidase [Candidatus Melainabacteria bacterium HGW-Melainabacteria-1]
MHISSPSPLNETPTPPDQATPMPKTTRLDYFDALPGGLLIWIVFLVEMGTFALFFLVFAWLSRAEPEVFASSQALLHPDLGTLNTLILLSGSWLAARAVLASRKGTSISPWLLGTGLSGLVFLGIKLLEYSQIFAQGIRLSTNAFWFNYLFLTLLHNLHVIAGIYFLFYLAWHLRRGPLSSENRRRLEAAALYWHLVDVIWVLLFPLIYFSRNW